MSKKYKIYGFGVVLSYGVQICIIGLNISYKISINYCAINTQIIIEMKYDTLSYVCLISILQFIEYFLLIFDNSNVNKNKQTLIN